MWLSDSGWSVGGRADLLDLEGRRAKGRLHNLEANLYYRLAPAWSASLGYRVVEYRVDRKGNGEIDGRFEYRFRGPQLQIEAGF